MKRSLQEQEYIARINRAMDFIQNNLDRPLQLKEVAEAAHFSPFHFHRVFRGAVGETVGGYIQRLRVEKAASLLITSPKISITAVALDCGFSTSASFARVFRSHYGMSAGQWRSGGCRDYHAEKFGNSKIGQANRKNRIETDLDNGYFDTVQFEFGAESSDDQSNPDSQRRPLMATPIQTDVVVRNQPEMTVAYVRHIGPYKGDEKLFEGLYSKLMTWAGARGLLAQPDLKCLQIYHDNPEITDESNLRLDVCISVPEDTTVEGEIGKMTVPGGKFAAARFEITPDQYQQAWDYVFATWLPDSGYQPDDRPPYELCLNDPREHPEHKHIVEICIPVRPL